MKSARLSLNLVGLFQLALARMPVQSEISDFGFEVQDSSNFKIPSRWSADESNMLMPSQGGEYDRPCVPVHLTSITISPLRSLDSMQPHDIQHTRDSRHARDVHSEHAFTRHQD